MIEFTPTPVLVSFGPLAVRYYALAYLIGFVAAWLALRRSTFREHADDLTLWTALGVVIGGRLGYVLFYEPSMVWLDPLGIFALWRGGMAFHGGLLGCFLAVALYARSRTLSLWRLADILTAPALVGIVLGRVANFLNGELAGTVTDVAWCVVTAGVPGCRHPSPLYEAAYTLAILAVVVLLYRRREWLRLPAGAVFGWFLVLYGALRTIVNAWRDDPRVVLGLSTGQLLSFVTGVVGIIVLVWLHRKRDKLSGKRKRR
jgi:phosphatidylglycerol:prolipoprotein diacylglycerol transferase